MDRRTLFRATAGAALLSPIAAKGLGQTAQRPGPADRAPTAEPTGSGLRVRRNVQTMAPGDPFFQQYATAVQRMHALPANDRRNWRQQALIHLNNCVHGGQDFFHWHRHYITWFERICGELIGDRGFALAYWDWAANQGRIPDPFYDVNFLNVAHWNDPSNAASPNWAGGALVGTIGRRGRARGRGLQDDPVRGGPFTPDSLANITSLTDFAQFTDGIEGSPHGSGHVIVGSTASGASGHMAEGLSPLDPIFWLHHCNVDRIWEEWRNAGNRMPSINRTYANHFVDTQGRPVATASAAETLNATAMGFRYDGAVIASADIQPTTGVLRSVTDRVRSAAGIGRLGRVTVPTSANVGTPASTPLTINNLANVLAQRRAQGPTATDAARPEEGGVRIVLRFTNVTIDKDHGRVIVNMFVNCPYLSAATPYSDPHYIGSFAFFGHGSSHAGHGGRTASMVLNASKTLRRLVASGVLKGDQLQIQLMPVAAAPGATSDAKITIGGIEALRG